jgi:hypothetical protein
LEIEIPRLVPILTTHSRCRSLMALNFFEDSTRMTSFCPPLEILEIEIARLAPILTHRCRSLMAVNFFEDCTRMTYGGFLDCRSQGECHHHWDESVVVAAGRKPYAMLAKRSWWILTEFFMWLCGDAADITHPLFRKAMVRLVRRERR